MAQKFGNGRWVKEGFLDNRTSGSVVGRIVLAGVGPVDLFLRGDCRGEIEGQAVCFRNSRFADEELAGHVLADLDTSLIGDVSLISFDPHPLLTPHPYIEWFSSRKDHYRIELAPEDAWIARADELAKIDGESSRIREALGRVERPDAARDDADWM
ncbi:MAG TPA: hypothetical protein VHF07_08435 [Nitrospiraceae bacterium]|nr:hypothetical protein [Nitrospiraceae bacterium]